MSGEQTSRPEGPGAASARPPAGWRAPDWPRSVFSTAVAVGIALLVLSGWRPGTGWPRAVGVAALTTGLVGGWCLVVVQLLTSPRGSAVREVVMAAVGAGPPSLFLGMLMARAMNDDALVPEVALSPLLAVILTPALVGWLVVLAWRLIWPPGG